MGKIITITVPTYNAEKYLRTNLESFCIEEILDDIEVLIINDGSKDGSLRIAEEYCERYPQAYRVISKENGGHGSGINCGILHAKGKYFKVVDADDWVEKDAFLRLIQFLKQADSDIVYSGFLWAYDRGEDSVDRFQKKAEFEMPFREVIYGREYLFDEIANKLYIKMHNMTIKTRILRDHQIRIDEHCFYVDSEYISYPIPYVNTISFLDGFVYMYRIGTSGQSVSLEQMQRNESHYNQVLRSLLAFYSGLGQEVRCSDEKRSYLAGIVARVVAGKYKIMLSFPANREKKEQLRSFDKKIKKEFPDVYSSNVNAAVKLLRMSGYWAYTPISRLVRKKYGA